MRVLDSLDQSTISELLERDEFSMVSNRLNSISKQLTIVATIFLPLAVASRSG